MICCIKRPEMRSLPDDHRHVAKSHNTIRNRDIS